MAISTINSSSTTGVIQSGTAFSPAATLNATFNGTTTMTVNSVSSGAVIVGQILPVTNYPVITAQLTGTTGGAGTYTLSATVPTTTVSMGIAGFEFRNIPSWVKRVTVLFSGMSNGYAGNFCAQLGTASGIQSSGYVSNAISVVANQISYTNNYGLFILMNYGNSGSLQNGSLVFTLVGSNTWLAQSVLADGYAASVVSTSAGRVALSGTLDRVRILPTAFLGNDIFDAGSLNILYE